MADESDAVYDVGQACYEMGYREGEASGYADWFGPLSDVLPEGFDIAPRAVADWVDVLQRFWQEHGGQTSGWR